MNKTNFILSIIGAILIIDVLMFFAWVASGQRPQTDVYGGMITASIVKAMLPVPDLPCTIPDAQFSGATEGDYPECK